MITRINSQITKALLVLIVLGADWMMQAANAASSQQPPSTQGLATIYQDEFEGDLSQWVVEQMPGGATVISDGKLEINDAAGCTVWFQHKLNGPLMIEYVATVIDEGGEHDRVSDLNCFWMARDPQNPNDLFANSQRTGLFSDYDSLGLYYVGYGGHSNTRTRFRRYAGDGSRPLLPEHDLSDAQFMITPNVPTLIQIIANGSTIQYFRDGELIFDFQDSQPYTEGWFGFRTVDNHMTVDNFRVFELSGDETEQRHPFLLFEEEDYVKFRSRASEEPWASWKTEAMQFAAADWSNETRMKSRAREDTEVISCNALLYILDPDNADIYRNRIVEGIGIVSSYPTDGSANDWMYSVPPGSACFVSLVALDIIWNDLDPAQRESLLDSLAERIGYVYDGSWQLNSTAVKGTLALMQGDTSEYKRQRDLHFERIHSLLTEDGGFSEGSTYGLDRLAAASWERYTKGFFLDVIHQQGDHNVYGDQQLQGYFKWALTHSVSPAGYASTFGDTYFSSTPINDKHSATLHRLHRFGDEIGALASWALGDVRSRANLFSYVLTDKVVAPEKPTSAIYTFAGAAFIDPNLPEDETNFAALWSTTKEGWHSHKDINALYLEAFGTPIMANTGYANYNTAWHNYSWNYINNQAYGNNVVLINGADHVGKTGGGAPVGITADCLDFAQGDSGNAISGGKHYRNLMLIHADPNLSAGGYFAVIDEVSTGSPSLLFHPVSTTHTEVIPGTHYRHPIAFRGHERTDFNLDIFLGQTPTSVTFQLGAMTSYNDELAMETEYMRANYPSGSPPITTVLYPNDAEHPLPNITRLTQGNYHGSIISHSVDTVDYLLSSVGNQDINLAGNTARGKGIVLREHADLLEFVLMIEATKFLDESGHGFESDEPVNVLLDGDLVKVSAKTNAKVTLYKDGIKSVILNGKQVASEAKGEGFITIPLTPGTHDLELSSIPESPPPSSDSAVYLPANGDAFIRGGTFADRNFGSGSLQIKGSESPEYTRKSLIQFDLSQLPRQPGWATLRLNLKNAADEAPNALVRLSITNNSWSESQVTFANAPAATSSLTDINLPNEGEYILVNVPSNILLEAWQKKSLISFQFEALQIFGGNGIVIHSREAEEQWLRPSLIVTQVGEPQLVGAAVTPTSVTASKFQPLNTPAQLIDGDLSTAWVADGDGASAIIDLGSVVPALAIDIAFAHGNGQTSYFDLAVSNDGESFAPLATGISSDTAAGSIFRIHVEGNAFRYLRIIGHGNNVDAWNRIAEIQVISNPRVDTDADDLPDSWEMANFGNLSVGGDLPGRNTSMSIEDIYEFGPLASESVLYEFPNNDLSIIFYAEPALGSGYEGLSRFYAVEMSESLLANDWRSIPGLARIPANAEWIEVTKLLDVFQDNPSHRGFARIRAWLE